MLSITQNTSEQASSNISTTIQLPVGAVVDGIQVNTGSVTWSHNEITGVLTANCSGGAVYTTTTSYPQDPNNPLTTSQTQVGSSSFPSSIAGTDGVYSGNYYQNGSPTSTQVSEPKTVTTSGDATQYDTWNGSSWQMSSVSGGPPANGDSYYYNDGTWAGTLTCTGHTTSNVVHTYPSNPTKGQTYEYDTFSWQATYSGTVYSTQYTQNYIGYFQNVNSPSYTNWWMYAVTAYYHVPANSRFFNVSHYGGNNVRGVAKY